MFDPDLPDEIEWEIDGREDDDLMLNLRCTICRKTATQASQYAREWADGHGCYNDEPTEAQLEALNNPDSGPSTSHYRDALRDAGRGGAAQVKKRETSCKHILHYCDRCYGPMEFHDGCVMQEEPHWYCLTANCGTVTVCEETV